CFLPGSSTWWECVSVSTILLRGHIILIYIVGVHTVGTGRLRLSCSFGARNALGHNRGIANLMPNNIFATSGSLTLQIQKGRYASHNSDFVFCGGPSRLGVLHLSLDKSGPRSSTTSYTASSSAWRRISVARFKSQF